MKTGPFLLIAPLLLFSGCSSMHTGPHATAETVLITYHVKPGSEAEFETTLAAAWKVYRDEHYVFAAPHLLVRNSETDDKPRFVEIFTWAKSPDHAPSSIKEIWNQEQSLCEARDGHTAIEGGEVHIVAAR